MLIALLNASKYYAAHAVEAGLIAQAVNLQLHRHVSPTWGTAPWSCVFYPDAAQVPSSAYRLWLLDNVDQAKYLGYHDVDPDGHPYGRIFVEIIMNNGGTSLSGDTAVSTTTSHEACEIVGDDQVNTWREMPDGNLISQELSDPVESDNYPMTVGTQHVSVSNFVLPEYFAMTPVRAAKFDYLGRLSAPFTMSSGGYQILKVGGEVTQKFADEANYPEWKKALKLHPASRTARRAA